MKINKVVLENNDFEKYTIPISLGNWFPKAKNKYIWGELEKRHPCFSNEFCFFSKDKLSKKGIVSDVFVIEKRKINNLQKTIAKKGLIIGGKNIIKANKKIFLITILICVFLLIIASIIFIELKKNIKDTEPLYEEIQKPVIKSFNAFDKNHLENLLKITKNNKGIIRNLTWKITNTGEKITGTIEKIFPEKLEVIIPDVKIQSIKYIEKKPYFDFFITNSFAMQEANYSHKVSSKNRELVRNKLKETNIEIIEENTEPYIIILSLPIEKIIYQKRNELAEFEELLRKEKLYLREVNVVSMGENKGVHKINISLTFTECEIFNNNILGKISNNLELFYEKTVVKTELQQKVVNVQNIQKSENDLIGEVNYKSGKKVSFYRTPEGKIIKKEAFFDGKI